MLDFPEAIASTASTASTDKIKKIHHWLAQNPFDVDQYKQVLSDLKLTCADFRPLYRFSHEHYTRNVLIKTDEYEMILICWEVGQLSPIHNHGFSQCAVHCLEGSTYENSYLYQESPMSTMPFHATKTIMAGETTLINDPALFHEYGNASKTDRAVTLHLYAPRITVHNIFDKTTGAVTQRVF